MFKILFPHIHAFYSAFEELMSYLYGKKDFTEVSKNLVRYGFENNFNELSK